MTRPIHATVHTQALRHNLQRCREAAQDSQVWAVVKANAYGHGIERAFDGLRAADGLALLEVSEAERVRRLGWRGPILLLEGVFDPRELEACSRLSLWLAVHDDTQIDWLAAHKTHVGLRVFLKVNTGMNRLGFAPERVGAAHARLTALPQVEEVSFMTHFSDADGPKGVACQLARFEQATHDLPGERSLANSAALLRLAGGAEPGQVGQPSDAMAAAKSGDEATRVRGDWVRAGISLYGSSPDHPAHTAADWGLQPAMTLASRIIGVQAIAAGESVGYGSRFVAEQSMRIGTVACGYADGYPRHALTGTPVLVDGVRTRTLGRVSMDMLAVDLTPVPQAGWGSEVTLWGRAANGAVLCIDEVAEHAGTLGYELMCAVAPRVPMQVD